MAIVPATYEYQVAQAMKTIEGVGDWIICQSDSTGNYLLCSIGDWASYAAGKVNGTQPTTGWHFKFISRGTEAEMQALIKLLEASNNELRTD